jgi:hypothetical protein
METSDDERRIINLSVIPAAILTYILVALFIYIIHSQPQCSLIQYLLYFGVPFVVGMPAAVLLSYEILSSQKSNESFKRHFKRFLHRMSIIILGTGIFMIIMVAMYLVLSLQIGEWNVLLIAGTLWFSVWIPLVFRFRKTFRKLSNDL